MALTADRKALYEEAVSTLGDALARLGRAYEGDPEKCRDLMQEVHLALWRSFERFEGRCSLRTWVYRVAHNVAASHLVQQRRAGARALVSLEEIELAGPSNQEHDTGERLALERLMGLIHHLRPPDRQLMILYLEDLDSTAIGEIMSLSPGTVRVHIHRIKSLLKRRFHGRTL